MLVVITVASLGVAIAMTIVAWRATREERRRAEARVAALAAEIGRDDADERALRDAARPAPLGEAQPDAPVASANLFDDLAVVSRPSRTAAAIATVVFIVGSGAALAVVITGSSSVSRTAAAASARAVSPLELVALGHERDGNSLAVYGAIRNPPGGANVNGLSAVVFLYSRDGRFTTSTRAPIDTGDLAAGAESRFRVVVANAEDIGRYRVSFRTDRGIVPHVDRRTSSAAGGQR